MPDSPKPSGTTVTHAERKRAIVESTVLVRDESRRFQEYCDELHAALESERAVCRLASASKENYRKLRDEAEKRTETAEQKLDDLEHVCPLPARGQTFPERVHEYMTVEVPRLVEQARQEGYERGKAERDG